MRRSLTKLERLHRRQDVSRAFRARQKVSCRGAKLLYQPNSLSFSRILLVPTRRYPNAVRRNAAKRYGREAYRYLKPEIAVGYDYVFILYPGTDSFQSRVGQFHTLLGRAGVLRVGRAQKPRP